MSKVAVLLPAYNEEVSIASMVLLSLQYADEVIVIDDGSSDRTSEVPILFSNTAKIQKLGAKTEHSVSDIIKDQLNYFIKEENR